MLQSWIQFKPRSYSCFSFQLSVVDNFFYIKNVDRSLSLLPPFFSSSFLSPPSFFSKILFIFDFLVSSHFLLDVVEKGREISVELWWWKGVTWQGGDAGYDGKIRFLIKTELPHCPIYACVFATLLCVLEVLTLISVNIYYPTVPKSNFEYYFNDYVDREPIYVITVDIPYYFV